MITLFEMSNIRGKFVKIEDLDFSFYYSSKDNVNNQHGIRVKICWNREKIDASMIDGYLELHGDYKYKSSPHPTFKPDSVDIATARYFFKRYKVLFAAVWEKVLDENILSDYLRGTRNLKETIDYFENISDHDLELLKRAGGLKELEKIVRKYSIFNMND